VTHIFVSPYLPLDKPVSWLKGNHHGHSMLSDGADTPEENLRAYEAAGYAYFALSEHDVSSIRSSTGQKR
jgi:predicted metal-dependent phosphoesterase TrpH